MLASIAGLPAFLAYCVAALALVAIFLFVYTKVTAHNEFVLIRNNVSAAGVSLGLALVGYSIPLSSAMRYAANVWDMMIWGVIALIVQIMIYFVVRLVFPDLSNRIEANEHAVAIFAGAAAVAGGTLNAVAMSY
ncbi:MAG: DUF350 domain-containing protein [Beijerinckiaceae bacterium]